MPSQFLSSSYFGRQLNPDNPIFLLFLLSMPVQHMSLVGLGQLTRQCPLTTYYPPSAYLLQGAA